MVRPENYPGICVYHLL